MPKVPKTISSPYLCNISRKTCMINLIFCLLINVKGLLKACVPRHVEIIQNKTFVHDDKHRSLLQTGTMIFMGMVRHSQSSQNSKFAMSLQYPKNEIKVGVNYLHADKHQKFLQVDSYTLVIKISCKVILSLLMGTIKHSQSTRSNKFVISLQYLKKS